MYSKNVTEKDSKVEYFILNQQINVNIYDSAVKYTDALCGVVFGNLNKRGRDESIPDYLTTNVLLLT